MYMYMCVCVCVCYNNFVCRYTCNVVDNGGRHNGDENILGISMFFFFLQNRMLLLLKQARRHTPPPLFNTHWRMSAVLETQ